MLELEYHENAEPAELIRQKIQKIEADLAELDEKAKKLEREVSMTEATGGLDMAEDLRQIAYLHSFLEKKKEKLEKQLAELFK